MENLNLVIFDMDGLMFDTERRYCEDIQKDFDKMNIPIDIDAIYDVMGTSLRVDMKRFNKSQQPDDMVENLIHKSHLDSIEDMCENGVPVKKGLFVLLETLKKAKIKMVVATSTRIEISGRLLQKADVLDYFDFVVTSGDVEHGKPAPDIFLEACRRANCSPKNALVLEDSINGCKAADAAGIRFIIVPDIKQPTEEIRQSAYMTADSLLDVAKIIY